MGQTPGQAWCEQVLRGQWRFSSGITGPAWAPDIAEVLEFKSFEYKSLETG